MSRNFNLDEFVKHYAIAALWSSNDNSDPETGGEPLDRNYSIEDIHPETMESMREECTDFVKANHTDLIEYKELRRNFADSQWTGEALAGHDFWLTRNGHGAGFWDRGLDTLGDRLTKAAKLYSTVDLYIGDDGKVHA